LGWREGIQSIFYTVGAAVIGIIAMSAHELIICARSAAGAPLSARMNYLLFGY
jgi:hypothetical protein